MADTLETMLSDEPGDWLTGLPAYQRESFEQLLSRGASYRDAAATWLTATTSQTAPFGAVAPSPGPSFLERLYTEIGDFICGSTKYKKERDDLFGKKGLARTYVVSAIAVAVSPALGLSATVLAPAVALLLASIGKIAVNAWCASRYLPEREPPAPVA